METSTKLSFNERCYLILQQVPPGKVTTYKAIAEALGTKAYRAVGNAMRLNPNLISTPCHRVVSSRGELGNYVLGVEKKRLLLETEGVFIKDNLVIDFKQICLHQLHPLPSED